MSVLMVLMVLLLSTGCSSIIIVADCDLNQIMPAVQQDFGLVFQVKRSNEITSDKGTVVRFPCEDVDWTNELWFGADCVFHQVKRVLKVELVRTLGENVFHLSARKSVVHVHIRNSQVFL